MGGIIKKQRYVRLFSTSNLGSCGMNTTARFWHRIVVPVEDLASHLASGWAIEESDKFDSQFGQELEKFQIVDIDEKLLKELLISESKKNTNLKEEVDGLKRREEFLRFNNVA